jgi:abhydrolase domain-containing protein 6
VADADGAGRAGRPARGGLVTASPVVERTVGVGGFSARVWEKGSGEPIGYLAGLGGLPRWTPFLDRLAERRRVIAPSLPGFPGCEGHDRLDDLLDWITATCDLLEGAGLDGRELVGASVGGALAAEVAALRGVPRLNLIAPFGIFDAAEPVVDPWAQRPGALLGLLTAKPETAIGQFAAPAGIDEVEWQVRMVRASEAAARLLWPICDTGVAKRLHRVTAPTLLVWGAEDRILPASYAKRFAERIAGPTEIRSIAGAGHLADLDAPDPIADAILART